MIRMGKLLAAVSMLTLAACDAGTPEERAEKYLKSANEKLRSEKYSAAVIEYKNAIQTLPDYAPARLQLGETYLARYQLEDADKELTRAHELGSPEEKVLPPLIRTKIMQNAFPAALALIESLPESMRNDPQIAIYHADALVGQGRYDEAKAVLEAASERSPEVIARFAQLEVLAGNREEARRVLAEAIEADPGNFDANLLLGRLEVYDGNKEKAIAAFRAAHARDPYAPQATLSLVALLVETGETKEARELLNQSAKNGFVSLQTLYLSSLIALQDKDYESAKTESEKVLSVNPRFRPALLVAGIANSALGNDRVAISHLERFAAGNEAMPGVASKALAWSHMRLGQADDALAAMERSGDTASDIESLRLATAAAMGSGEVEKAKEFLAAMLEKDPQNSAIAVGLASLMISTGDKEGAAKLLNETAGNKTAEASIEDQLRLGIVQLQAGQFEDALATAADLRGRFPDKAAGYLLTGLALGASGQGAAGEDMLKQALEREPGHFGAITALVRLYRSTGRLSDAETVLRRAAEQSPGTVDFRISLARLLLEEGRGEEAEAELRAIVAANPDDFGTAFILSRYLLTTGRADEARKIAEDALKRSPDNLGGLEVLGLAQRTLRDTEGAVRTFERLASLAPESAQAQFLLARSLADLGRADASIGALRQALTLDPSLDEARLILARLLLFRRDFELAGKELDEYEKRAGRTAESLDIRGHIAMRQNQPAEAVKLFTNALTLERTALRAVNLSQAQWALGDREAAIATLEAEESLIARMPLAQLYHQAGRDADSIALYKKLLEEYPDNPVILNDYAWLLTKLGRHEEAMPLAQRARDAAPESPPILDTWGVVALALGRTEDAIAAHREATRLAASDPDLRLNLAKALIAGGEKDEAMSLLASLVTLPGFDGRDEAQRLFDELRAQ
ncbi:MAG: hypothetical protein Tsb008_17140 [Rhodothalassiaceae bacterium]